MVYTRYACIGNWTVTFVECNVIAIMLTSLLSTCGKIRIFILRFLVSLLFSFFVLLLYVRNIMFHHIPIRIYYQNYCLNSILYYLALCIIIILHYIKFLINSCGCMIENTLRIFKILLKNYIIWKNNNTRHENAV